MSGPSPAPDATFRATGDLQEFDARKHDVLREPQLLTVTNRCNRRLAAVRTGA